MKKIIFILIVSPFFYSCDYKLLSKKSKFFYLKETPVAPRTFFIQEARVSKPIIVKIEEKTDFIIIKPKESSGVILDQPTSSLDADIVDSYLHLRKKYYFPELDPAFLSQNSLTFYDIKFGLQALTIPLRFRKSIGDGILNPALVETGVNIGFAPGFKFAKNTYRPTKNYLGKNISQISIATGLHFGLGATDLKKATNAPGLQSDTKRPLYTQGVYILLGLNNINVGFAVGRDYIIGTGKNNWVYQDRLWKGIIISLDVLKF